MSIQSQLSDTIAASATPPGTSGVALIRLSGPASSLVAAAIFKPASGRFLPANTMAGYTCALGLIIDPRSQSEFALQDATTWPVWTADSVVSPENMLDQVVLTRFAAPHSFTGEDVYEITCHGGQAVRQAILDLLYHLGVQPAGPGEFTRRAFLNGKLDLAQAEAVMDLIAASADKRAQAAMRQLQGQLSNRLREIRQDLYDLLAQLELVLEYPEHEESEKSRAGLLARLEPALDKVLALDASFRQGRLLSEGFTVVIVGRPNAGKSSLLNTLAGYDRAIVTPVAGTTRDTVEELIDIGGVPVRLIDTAGLRETQDLVEKIGVDRARNAIVEADLVLWLISPDEDRFGHPDFTHLNEELAEIRELSAQTDALQLIIGKEDLAASVDLRIWLTNELPQLPLISFSAQTLEGLDAMRQAILLRYQSTGSGQADEVLITSSRHKACLDKTSRSLALAATELQRGEMLDLAAALLRDAMENLAEITGDLVTDTLVETIFSRFCIGK
ncbi:MAG: tRNA uridine-5-carboxymethylaminomethyl(34) synthesis GTPase MnmE [Eubacteriales bacterium]|nr:tRNA uridine-5-carboxymethylaminomethyl(34) synthesis GTPase MnmE [Eubacteriales bacterium]